MLQLPLLISDFQLEVCNKRAGKLPSIEFHLNPVTFCILGFHFEIQNFYLIS